MGRRRTIGALVAMVACGPAPRTVAAPVPAPLPEPLATTTGIRDGNRLPTVPKYTIAASATYGTHFSDTGEWYVNANAQRIGSRYTQPSDQEQAGIKGLTYFDPATGLSGVVPTAFGTFPLGKTTGSRSSTAYWPAVRCPWARPRRGGRPPRCES